MSAMCALLPLCQHLDSPAKQSSMRCETDRGRCTTLYELSVTYGTEAWQARETPYTLGIRRAAS